jgi:uncharacterized membrane protein YoaK (UPF0700 family)
VTSFEGANTSAAILRSTDATEPLRVLIPSVDSSLGMKLLPGVLSLTAGSVDVISFLALGGLFTAHITGNLAILAAHIVSGGTATLAPMLSVPVFMGVLGLARLLAGAMEAVQVATLRPFLGLQFILLAGFFVLCVARGPLVDPNAPRVIVASMLGVAAMAVQSVLVQISLEGAPSTAVMTTNVTRFMMDVGSLELRHDPREISAARNRARHTWPAIVGFAIGCGLGAAADHACGLWSLALPTALALLACVMSLASDEPSFGSS